MSNTFPDSESGISVIITVLNEEAHLEESIRAIQEQDWPGPVQVVVALGPSHDSTDEVAARLAAEDSRIELVGNPTGRTPAGLNLALARTVHPIVARVDGHCVLPANYLSTAVELLKKTGAANVGGVMAAAGTTSFERAVAVAMCSRIGVGSAAFHVGGQEGPAETVYLGVFRREALVAAGGYDEEFERAQDWELNHRIRSAGSLVWFTPALSVGYRPRSNPRDLSRQYFNYGRWRRKVMETHRDSVQWRYLAAPAVVAAMATGVAAGLAGQITGRRGLKAGWAVPVGYAVGIAVGGLTVGRSQPPSVRMLVPVALATMHCSWGTGFLLGIR